MLLLYSKIYKTKLIGYLMKRKEIGLNLLDREAFGENFTEDPGNGLSRRVKRKTMKVVRSLNRLEDYSEFAFDDPNEYVVQAVLGFGDTEVTGSLARSRLSQIESMPFKIPPRSSDKECIRLYCLVRKHVIDYHQENQTRGYASD